MPNKSKAVSCSLKIYPREFCLQKEGLQITCVEEGVAFFRTVGIPQRKIPQPRIEIAYRIEAPGILQILQRLKFLFNHCV